ncbi:uncharacterized protein [Haliotis asinina]|uniref:uncharacterized protein n=1 Tax=Haliotis asinina TaxID=109174 RepID=UPI0035326AA8
MTSDCLQNQNGTCTDEEEAFVKNIPVVIMLALISTVGVVGNAVILCIYGLKFKESTTRVFILSLAVFDLLSCVTLPYKITLLRYGSLFGNPNLARLEIVRIYFVQLSLAILPLMSFDRYRRICQPLKVQMKPKLAKILVFGICILMGGLAVVRIVVTSYRDTHCYRAEAFISAEFVDKSTQGWLRELYFACAILPFIIPLPILTVVYSLIGIRVRQLTRKAVERPKDTNIDMFHPSRPSIPRTNDDVYAQTNNADCEAMDRKMSSLIRPNLFALTERRTEGISCSIEDLRTESLGGGLHAPAGMHSEQHCISIPSKHGTNESGAELDKESECADNTWAMCEPLQMDVERSGEVRRDEHSLTVHCSYLRRMKTNSFSLTRKTRLDNGQRSSFTERQPSGGSTGDCAQNGNAEVRVRAVRSMPFDLSENIVINGDPIFDDCCEGTLEPGPSSVAQNPPEGDPKAFNFRKKDNENRLSWKRITLIFFLITVVYILSFLPFFSIYIIFRVAPCDGYKLLSQAVYIVLYNCVYINSFSNCFLYGFFDPRFQRELRCVISRIIDKLCRKCRFVEANV